VARWDEDDPYLVVAADKGTATFSDIANGVSHDYGFWLDDAFASGGSAGYDHKKMGITARGAWESVKRHFRETGKNIQAEDFTVVGVGDMSGDVFGNGMLLSEHIKLVGAFNHLHIFIDPDPDPAKSFAERKRLFELPRSAWTDYNEKLISKGGGVFDRRSKSIKLSPQMKKLLRSDANQLTPNEVLNALLKAEVELLWFGGIGTYVKHSEESNAQAGDRANDGIRVNGKNLNCKVVGEGANLGMTQRARIEFALSGGRVNTDSIDNSAGVDCSDHEVNIKILLGDVEMAGDMTRKQRDNLLARMTDEVADLVLRDNYLQTQSITVTESLGSHLMDRLARFMRSLEKQNLLDRPIEFLPDDETIAERIAKGIGMTRPELAVLLSYAKITLYDSLIASNLPDDPFMESELIGYFPKPLQQKFADRIRGHRLRREIIATVVTNDLVNRVGAAFAHEVGEKTGMDPEDIARAYTVAHAVFDMEALYGAIESLDNKVSAACQSSMLTECGRTIERATVWLLRHAQNPIDIAAEVESYRSPVAELADNLAGLLPKTHLQALDRRNGEYEANGVPSELAARIAGLANLAPALDIVRVAGQQDKSVLDVGRAYFIVGDRFGLDWLRQSAGRLPSDTAWEKLAVTAIVDDLYGHQSDLTRHILTDVKALDEAEKRIEDWAQKEHQAVARTERVIAEIQSHGTADLAMLAVANRQLRALVDG
jgi:glutamate dehydrogenase